MNRLFVEITKGKRAYKEDVTEEAREYFDECVSNGANSHLMKLGWDEWTKEIIVNEKELSDLNGRHFLYGWIESFMQSDECPNWINRFGPDEDDIWYEFYFHEDGNKF